MKIESCLENVSIALDEKITAEVREVDVTMISSIDNGTIVELKFLF